MAAHAMGGGKDPRGEREAPALCGPRLRLLPGQFSSACNSARLSHSLYRLPSAAAGFKLVSMATVPDLTLDAGLPANVDAEKTILGAILLDNAAHAEAAGVIKAEDFSLDSHRRIFLRMSELMDSSRAVDIVTLANELAKLQGNRSRWRRGLSGLAHRGIAAPPGD